MMATRTTAPSTRTAGLTKSLNQVLADSYALLSLTHLAHWNVEGPGFFALHTAFQTQYEELFVAIDEIAERIRALACESVPRPPMAYASWEVGGGDGSRTW
jgi:starvation-inducible DNA-binding protein